MVAQEYSVGTHAFRFLQRNIELNVGVRPVPWMSKFSPLLGTEYAGKSLAGFLVGRLNPCRLCRGELSPERHTEEGVPMALSVEVFWLSCNVSTSSLIRNHRTMSGLGPSPTL